MNKHTQSGFTLIELMVALVVGMLLMSSLVALSGSVQKSFGRSKDITDLQGNLRFAMKTLVDDMSRISFMTSPDPNQDTCHRKGPLPAGVQPAISWDGSLLDFRGNYISSRDYRWNADAAQIVCRNEAPFDSSQPDSVACGGYDTYLQPFNDGPANLDDIFCPGMIVRLEGEQSRYVYLNTTAVANAANTLQLDPYDRARVQGDYLWVSPMSQVQYQVVNYQTIDPSYQVLFSPASPAAQRFVLVRRYRGCNAGNLTFGAPVELADFLLPQAGLQPGLEISYVQDTNGTICQPAQAPAFSGELQLVPDNGNIPNPVQTRSMVVTLRGRTEAEDPAFTIASYPADPAMRYGVDLDTVPENGLAHVREERTVIQLRNLGLNMNL